MLKAKKAIAILLALLLVLCLVPASAFAEGEDAAAKLPYDGDAVGFYKEDLTSAFGMLTPQEGSTCEIDGDYVVIHIIPKNTTTYVGMHWGTITDTTLSKDVTFNEDGTIDLKLAAADYCGYAHPIAPLKSDGGTSSAQYYLAIPAADKLPKKVEKLPYDGDEIGFFKEDLSSAFGMLKPQEGSTCEIDGDKVVIHIIPKNTTVYDALHWGAITDELTKDVKFNEDGTIDLKLAASEYCGFAHPVAPVKADGTGTTSAQYYLAIPAADKLPKVEHKVEKIPYDGDDLGFFKDDLSSKFGMLAPQEGSTCEIDGDNVVIHIIPKNTTVYNALHWGAITDELTKDVNFNEDGTIDLKLPAADYCGFAHPVAPVKADGTGTTSAQYYLAIPAADKLPEAKPGEEPGVEPGDEPGEEPASDVTSVQLTVTNNTGMFKVDEKFAFLEAAADGSLTLYVRLTGSSYENLFKGNYEEAKANGDNREKWIKGTVVTVDDKKQVEFRIPIAEGESYIPLVSISNSYLAKYEAGENPLERAFYPRQMELDAKAKTLVVGDYENSKDLTIENNVKMFSPKSAKLTTVGGPNSNNYATTLEFLYGSDSFDKAFIGKASEADSAEIVTPVDRLYSFKLMWVENAGKSNAVVHDLMKDSFTVSFHSVKNDSWYERIFTVQEEKGKLIITEAAKDDDIVKIVSSKDKNGAAAPVTLKDVEEKNLLTKPIAVKVNPKVDSEDLIDIKWQKDIVVPEGTEFPVTIEFEYKDKDANFFIYHFNGTAWEVVGEGAGGKATVTFDSLSPGALVASNNPNTGDHAAPYIWGAAVVVCIAAAAVLLVRRRKEEK